jgi:hypothetical protein
VRRTCCASNTCTTPRARAAPRQAAADAEVDAVNKEVAALAGAVRKLRQACQRRSPQATIAKLQDRARFALERNEGTEQEIIQNTNRLIAALQTKAKWEGKVELQDKGSDLVRANQLLEVMTALDDVARDAAGGMVDSFGRVGDAIGGMTTALTGYGRAQAAIAANLAQEKTDAKGDVTKIKLAETKASQAAATAQIRQYGDMASAGKKFFKEHTAGYKVLEGCREGASGPTRWQCRSRAWLKKRPGFKFDGEVTGHVRVTLKADED